MDGIRNQRPWVLSGSYPCDPWLTGLESTKAFFTTDSEWMGNGWDSRQAVLGFYPDRIRVIRGENGRKSAHGKHGRHGIGLGIFNHGCHG